MKKLQLSFSVYLVALLLAGCSTNNNQLISAPADNPDDSHTYSSISDEVTEVVNSDSSQDTEYAPISRDECEQIVTLFTDWGNLDYNIHPDQTNAEQDDYFPDCVDESQYITEEITRKGSTQTYTEYFYKVISGDYSTEKGFNQKVSDIFTENFKEKYFASSSGQMVRFKNGETYVAGFSHYNATEPTFSLTVSIEYTGEDTIEISVSNAADNESDVQKYSAKLVKAKSGNYKIDAVGKDDGSMFELPRLFHYKSVEVIVCRSDNVLFTL